MIQTNSKALSSPNSLMAVTNPLPLAKSNLTESDGQILAIQQLKKKKANENGINNANVTTISLINRKRSAEPRPHPPHLLNKRYWDDVKAGRAKPPQSSTSSLDTMTNKKPKLEPIPAINGKQQQQSPPKPSLLVGNTKKHQRIEPTPPNMATQNHESLTTTIRRHSTTISPVETTISPQHHPTSSCGPAIRLPFPPLPPPFPPNFGSTLPLGPPPPNFHLLPPPALATSRFLPPFTPQLFSGTSSANHLPPPPPFIPTPPFSSAAPSFQFPSLINDSQQQQQQAIALGNALSFFSEIFRRQQETEECTLENGPENDGKIATLEEQHNSANGPSVSDEQIDRILDEIMMGREGNRKENQNNEVEGEQDQQHLCILPIPIFVPIPLPVGTDFILKHYCGENNMSKKT